LCVIVSGLVISSVSFDEVRAHTLADKIPAKIPAPEFTVTFKDLSYDIPASTSKDPYTGEKIVNPTYRVENRTLQVTINQKDLMKNYNWSTDKLSYTVQIKGSFEDEWNSWRQGGSADPDSQLTTIIFSSAESYLDGSSGSIKYCFPIPSEGKMDVQVKAKIHGFYDYEDSLVGDVQFGGRFSYNTLLAESDWSKTQTITINSSSGGTVSDQPQQSQDLGSSPNQGTSQQERTMLGFTLTELSLIVAVISLTIAVISISLLFVYRKKVLALS